MGVNAEKCAFFKYYLRLFDFFLFHCYHYINKFAVTNFGVRSLSDGIKN